MGSALLWEPRAAALHCKTELPPRPPVHPGSSDQGKGWLEVTPWACAAGEGRLVCPPCYQLVWLQAHTGLAPAKLWSDCSLFLYISQCWASQMQENTAVLLKNNNYENVLPGPT